jgi:hypothetical protein
MNLLGIMAAKLLASPGCKVQGARCKVQGVTLNCAQL